MKSFEFVNPASLRSAISTLASAGEKAKLLAGGIDLLGEMKDYIQQPDIVVNLKSVPGLNRLTADRRGLRIGPLVTLTEIAEHPVIRANYTALAEAAESVGTPQIRNVGTIGGNLCQRPRCWYYRDEAVVCLKKGGSVCYAVEGENQFNAVLGGGPSWIVHPSDCAPALIALNASVEITGPQRRRVVPLEKFFTLPTQNVLQETILEPGEIVTQIIVPAPAAGTRSHYMKVRHKESFDWALSGAAVMLQLRNRRVAACRVVLSGVAPIPWRSPEAEAVLRGKAVTPQVAMQAGQAAMAKARPLGKNAYKVPLTRNVVKLAVLKTAGV